MTLARAATGSKRAAFRAHCQNISFRAPRRTTLKKIMTCTTTCYKRDTCNTNWHRVAFFGVPAKAMTNIRAMFKTEHAPIANTSGAAAAYAQQRTAESIGMTSEKLKRRWPTNLAKHHIRIGFTARHTSTAQEPRRTRNAF
eukprot:6211854-Pleurochrysis_carterae.AAC.1